MNLKQIKLFLNANAERVFEKLGMKYENLGDNIYCTCPVHESSDNPRAFSFSKTKKIWKCWTRECQNEFKNDLFGLIRGTLSNQRGNTQNFADVLFWVKQNFNIKIDSNEPEQNQQEEDHEIGFETIVQYINDDISLPTLKHAKLEIELKIPSPYFLNRGFKAKTLEYFGVGDCLDKSSKLFDRAIIPIHSDCGEHVIGYTCRSIKEYKLPKFLIYPKGFDKRFTFYNMHRALPYIRQSNSVVIVEGQGDVWKLYESGVYNAIGMFGRTLTREQQKKLQQLPITHIIVLTDNDQAGRESKIQLQRQLSRFYRLSFPKLSQKDVGDMSVNQIQTNIMSQVRG